jgi:hypothetical protein
MGIGDFFKGLAKGLTSFAGSFIPILGPALAAGINSLYAEGTTDLKSLNAQIKDIAPDNAKFKVINSASALQALVDKHPVEARKAGITSDTVSQLATTMAKGGQVKAKKPRSKKQMEATKKLVAFNKARKLKK